jgi:hypothetical protein
MMMLLAATVATAFSPAILAGETYALHKPGTLTFNKDVAPIVFARCAGCHHPGQTAPFNLLGYADVKKRVKQIGEVAGRRYMPPWLPAKGHGEFAGDRSLSAEQIGIIEQWIAEGAVEGAAGDLPPAPKWTDGWELGAPDLVVQLPQSYVLPPDGKDVYRNFVVPIPVSERKYVKGVEFHPGNLKVVHHSFINIDPTPFSRRIANKGKQNPPGFDGMELTETASMPGGQILSWQPGKAPKMSPKGLAWTLEKNTDLVLQLHLHPSGKPEPVLPSVGFYFTDQAPTNTPYRINLSVLKIDIPAGVKDYVVETKYTLPIDVDLIGILPHAHYLAKRMEGQALLPDGTRKDLLLIEDWDFNWQGDYRYAKPIFLPKGTTLAMRYTYDNSADNVRNPNHPPKEVKYGLQTTDEMGELWFQVLPRDPSPAERTILAKDFYEFLGRNVIDYNEYILKENPNDAQAHTRAGRAEHYFGRVADALSHFQAAVKADPNYDKAYYELGYLYLRFHKFPEAQQAFENVVRLNPDDFEAEGSLGYICLQQGKLDQAETHFRAALRINPDDQIARQNLELVLKARAGARTGG